MNLVSLQKLLISPCFGLFAPSTLFATSSIAGPTAPITVKTALSLKIEEEKCVSEKLILFLPQQWVLQESLYDELPEQVLPPQEGLGLLQDLVS